MTEQRATTIWGPVADAEPLWKATLGTAYAGGGNRPVVQKTHGLRTLVQDARPSWLKIGGISYAFHQPRLLQAAVEPRENYPRIWARQKSWMRMDPDLEGVWSVTCFVVRQGFRRQGLMYELTAATVEYGRQVGARVLEGYPTEPPPGKTVIWDEASVGLLQVFLDAGYEVEASPTLRRRVVRHRLGASS